MTLQFFATDCFASFYETFVHKASFTCQHLLVRQLSVDIPQVVVFLECLRVRLFAQRRAPASLSLRGWFASLVNCCVRRASEASVGSWVALLLYLSIFKSTLFVYGRPPDAEPTAKTAGMTHDVLLLPCVSWRAQRCRTCLHRSINNELLLKTDLLALQSQPNWTHLSPPSTHCVLATS